MSIVPFLIHGRFFEEEEKRPYEKMYEATTGRSMTEFVEKTLEHIERNPTKCPYCGNTLDCRLMGYPIVDLLVLLESLRLNGIRPEDVKKHTLDIEFAYQSVMKALEEQMNKMFEGRAE